MTRIKKLPALLLIVATSTIVAAQTRTQAQTEWQRMFDMGPKYGTALELYAALKSAAHGGLQSPPFARLPDWSGLWTASGGGSFFGLGPTGVSPKLTPAAAAALNKGKELDANGISYDENLSECGPPGFPRWLVIPFLREFIVRPEQTWLSSETVNNVRRIYTDGRNHPPVEDRFPLYYGDSIGFWDDQKLVIHTNQLMKRSMGRNEPEQSEQMETVEIWEKTDARTIEAKVWIYDPALYVEPWYLTRRYTQVANTDKSVRMNYWHCGENPNNDVYKTPDGSTQFREFTFSPKDKR
ncbi:MAG: hypothetical protein AUI54_03210 [Acidobacteria bacterium 13_1_40CM_2_56_5]|nr:MAG: hypothetical protein AUI54_03210 [Acidobacteria bacterium 13_1_40CM_2_56_5]